jgi:hypothetical protein
MGMKSRFHGDFVEEVFDEIDFFEVFNPKTSQGKQCNQMVNAFSEKCFATIYRDGDVINVEDPYNYDGVADYSYCPQQCADFPVADFQQNCFSNPMALVTSKIDPGMKDALTGLINGCTENAKNYQSLIKFYPKESFDDCMAKMKETAKNCPGFRIQVYDGVEYVEAPFQCCSDCVAKWKDFNSTCLANVPVTHVNYEALESFGYTCDNREEYVLFDYEVNGQIKNGQPQLVARWSFEPNCNMPAVSGATLNILKDGNSVLTKSTTAATDKNIVLSNTELSSYLGSTIQVSVTIQAGGKTFYAFGDVQDWPMEVFIPASPPSAVTNVDVTAVTDKPGFLFAVSFVPPTTGATPSLFILEAKTSITYSFWGYVTDSMYAYDIPYGDCTSTTGLTGLPAGAKCFLIPDYYKLPGEDLSVRVFSVAEKDGAEFRGPPAEKLNAYTFAKPTQAQVGAPYIELWDDSFFVDICYGIDFFSKCGDITLTIKEKSGTSAFQIIIPTVSTSFDPYDDCFKTIEIGNSDDYANKKLTSGKEYTAEVEANLDYFGTCTMAPKSDAVDFPSTPKPPPGKATSLSVTPQTSSLTLAYTKPAGADVVCQGYLFNKDYEISFSEGDKVFEGLNSNTEYKICVYCLPEEGSSSYGDEECTSGTTLTEAVAPTIMFVEARDAKATQKSGQDAGDVIEVSFDSVILSAERTMDKAGVEFAASDIQYSLSWKDELSFSTLIITITTPSSTDLIGTELTINDKLGAKSDASGPAAAGKSEIYGDWGTSASADFFETKKNVIVEEDAQIKLSDFVDAAKMSSLAESGVKMSFTSTPSGASFNPANLTGDKTTLAKAISEAVFSPPADFAGKLAIKIELSGASGVLQSREGVVIVQESNDPPSVQIADSLSVVNKDAPLEFTITDPDFETNPTSQIQVVIRAFPARKSTFAWSGEASVKAKASPGRMILHGPADKIRAGISEEKLQITLDAKDQSLNVLVNDLGNGGKGGSMKASKDAQISISCASLPALNVASAKMKKLHSYYVDIQFDFEFDFDYSRKAEFTCDKVFKDTTVKRLGANPSCGADYGGTFWVNLGSGFEVNGTSLHDLELLSGNPIKRCSSAASYTSDIKVEAPVVKAPKVKISGPRAATPCGTKTQYYWTAYINTEALSCSWSSDGSIFEQTSSTDLKSCMASPVVYGKDFETDATASKSSITTSFSVTAVFAAPVIEKYTVKIRSAAEPGVQVMSSPTNTITKRDSMFAVRARAKASECGSAMDMTFAWTVADSDSNAVNISSLTTTSTVLELPTSLLSANKKYKVKVTVADENSQTSSDEVELVVGSTNLLVNTIGEMTTDVFTDLVIPSSVTNYDGGTVTVKWTCQDIDSSACKSSSTGATLVIADGNTLNITKGELAGGMSYTITATASEGTRTTTSSTKVTVANEKTAAVLAHVLPAGSVQNNAPVTLSVDATPAYASSSLSYQWTYDAASSATPADKISIVSAQSNQVFNSAESCDFWTAGPHKFILKVTEAYADGSSKSVETPVSFTVLAGPQGPAQGSADAVVVSVNAEGDVTVSAGSFSDPEGNEISYSLSGAVVMATQSSNVFTFKLAGDGSNQTFGVTVSSSKGGCTVRTVDKEIPKPPAVSPDKAAKAMAALVTEAQQTGASISNDIAYSVAQVSTSASSGRRLLSTETVLSTSLNALKAIVSTDEDSSQFLNVIDTMLASIKSGNEQVSAAFVTEAVKKIGNLFETTRALNKANFNLGALLKTVTSLLDVVKSGTEFSGDSKAAAANSATKDLFALFNKAFKQAVDVGPTANAYVTGSSGDNWYSYVKTAWPDFTLHSSVKGSTNALDTMFAAVYVDYNYFDNDSGSASLKGGLTLVNMDGSKGFFDTESFGTKIQVTIPVPTASSASVERKCVFRGLAGTSWTQAGVTTSSSTDTTLTCDVDSTGFVAAQEFAVTQKPTRSPTAPTQASASSTAAPTSASAPTPASASSTAAPTGALSLAPTPGAGTATAAPTAAPSFAPKKLALVLSAVDIADVDKDPAAFYATFSQDVASNYGIAKERIQVTGHRAVPARRLRRLLATGVIIDFLVLDDPASPTRADNVVSGLTGGGGDPWANAALKTKYGTVTEVAYVDPTAAPTAASTAAPTAAPVTTPAEESSNVGAIVGGLVAAVVVIGVAGYLYMKNKKTKVQVDDTQNA